MIPELGRLGAYWSLQCRPLIHKPPPLNGDKGILILRPSKAQREGVYYSWVYIIEGVLQDLGACGLRTGCRVQGLRSIYKDCTGLCGDR